MPFTHSQTNTFYVTFNGISLTDDHRRLLAEAVVDLRTDGTGMFVLTFHDPEFSVADSRDYEVGSEVEIRVIGADHTGPGGELMKGEVTAVDVDYGPDGTRTIIRGFDRSHRLFRGRRSETYLNMRYSDILRKIAGRHGLSPKVDTTSTTHPYVAQMNLSDGEFARSLADEIGWDLRVDGKTLEFRQPVKAQSAPPEGTLQSTNPKQLVLGEDLYRLRATLTGAAQPSGVQVRGWDPIQKQAVVAEVSAPKSVAADVDDASVRKQPFGSSTYVATATGYRTSAAATEAANGLGEQLASAAVELHGEVNGDPELRAGMAVSVAKAGNRLSGKYVLTQTRHVFNPDEGYHTEIVAGGRQDRSVLGLLNGSAPPSPSQRWLYGVVPAVVTNNKDPENLLRVKVKFPWLSDEVESDWARVTQAVVGSGVGFVFLPEVNDEVLVAFEHGDFNHPYIVGSLYNGKDKCQKASDDLVRNGKVTTRRLETPARNRLVFFDEAGKKEGVTLRTGDDKYYLDLNKTGTKIAISSDGTVEISAAKNIKVETKQDLALEATGNVSIKGRKISLDAQTDVAINANANASIKANAKFSAQSAMAEVKANASAELSSTGILTVRGSLVKLN